MVSVGAVPCAFNMFLRLTLLSWILRLFLPLAFFQWQSVRIFQRGAIRSGFPNLAGSKVSCTNPPVDLPTADLIDSALPARLAGVERIGPV